MQDQTDNRRVVPDRTRKGWTAETLDRLGVVNRGGPLFVLPNGEKLYDDGRDKKVIAASGKPRTMWPDPEDQPGDVLLVVEGRADAISAAELGYPVVSVPNAGYGFNPGEAERIMAGRHRVYSVADCDEPGRAGARRRAIDLAEFGPAFFVDLAPDRDDKWDLGDVLARALSMDAVGGVKLARYFIDTKLDDAEHVVGASDDDPPGDDAPTGRAPWPEALAAPAFYGLAGTFARTVAPHSEADPAGLMIQFVAIFGCIAGTQAGWKVDGAFHPGRLWPLVVGDTSRGRKGTATSRVREVIELAAPGFWSEHARAGLESGQGVVWHVRDPIRKRRKPRKGETVDADSGGWSPRLACSASPLIRHRD